MQGIQHSRKRAIVVAYLIVLLLVFALVGAAAAYLMENSRVTDLEQQNKELQTKVDELRIKADKQPSTQPSTPTGDQQTITYKSEKGVTVTVYTPESGATVASPLGIVGEVPGSWSFEASFPVALKDGNGSVIGQKPAQVQGDWTSEDSVPFTVALIFDEPTTASGTLVLQKDNPSGLPENDDSVSIPVKFK